MATRNALHVKVLCLSAAFVLAASALAVGAGAQAGRPIPSPTPTPTPTPTNTPQPAPKFVAAPGDDRYRLVYTPGWDGPLRPGEKEIDAVRQSRMNNFVALLNEAGARGYRVRAVVDAWQPVAVVELDEAQYEYGWFETAVVARSGDFSRIYTRFQNFYAKQAAGGLRLAEHFVIERVCARFSTGFLRVEERCLFRDLYLLERRKGVERPRQFQLVTNFPEGRSDRVGDELTKDVRDGLAEGLRPAYAFSRFAVLLEEPWEPSAPSDGGTDFRVISQSGRESDDFEKAVNELARQGYRLHLSNYGVAVMRRGAGDTTPAEYLWLDAKDKNFAKRLAAAQEAGAVYRMTFPDDEREETRLVFERATGGDGRRRDYKVFRVELQFVENVAARKVATGLSPQSREALQSVATLLKEGYVVRDLFWADVAYLLLERAR
jgi:hypothetical protein